eukprot:gene34636-44775_t
MEKDTVNSTTSVYIFGNDDGYTKSKINNDVKEFEELPLDDKLKGYYAMSDQLSFGKLRPRAFLLLEIVVQAFRHIDTITQIFRFAGFNDMHSASMYLKDLLSSHKLMHDSAEERARETGKLAAAVFDSGSEVDSRRLYKYKHFENLLFEAHKGNNLWMRHSKIPDHNGRVTIAETGIVVEYYIDPSGDSDIEDKYLFTIYIPTDIVESAKGESIDTEDVVSQDSGETPLIPAIINLIWEVNNKREESAFELPCAVDEVTQSVIHDGIKTCFPQLVPIFTLLGEQMQPLNTDEALRNYLLREKNDLKAIHFTAAEEDVARADEQPSSYILVPLPQQQVAQKVLNQVCKVLLTSGEDLKNLARQFKKMEYVILVPKYNTLKQQTKDHILEHHNLVRPGKDVADLVELFGGNKSSNSPSERLRQSVLDASNKDTLYVLVVDECHFAPTAGAIPLLHEPEMRARENFVVLLISATPYNCLSTDSSIHEYNIVDWSSSVSATTRPNYVGFEHYFRSIAFSIPDAALADIRVSNVIVSLEALRHQEFGEFSHLAKVITDLLSKALGDKPYKVLCNYKDQKFVLSLALDSIKQMNIDVVDTMKEGLLYHLGFRNGPAETTEVIKLSFSANTKKVCATKETSIDEENPIESQHIRADQPLDELRDAMLDNAACTDWNHTNRKAKPLPPVWCRLLSHSDKARTLDFKNASIRAPSPDKMMVAKNGFTVIVDYILSLAYFGSTLEHGLRDASTGNLFVPAPKSDVDPVDIGEDRKDAIMKTFLQMVDESCYFLSTDKSGCCNIGHGMNAALKLMCFTFRNQNGGAISDDADCLADILMWKIV